MNRRPSRASASGDGASGRQIEAAVAITSFPAVNDSMHNGLDAAHSRAVVELARSGEAAAVQLVRESGRLIGEVLAASVNLYNPSVW